MKKEKNSKSAWLNLIIAIIAAFAIVILLSIFLNYLEKFITQEVQAAATKPVYQARRVAQSHPEIIKIAAKKTFTFWVKFKNTGQKNWEKQKVALKTADLSESQIAHSSWLTKNTAYQVKWGVPVGTTGTFKFIFQAPEINGLRWEKLVLWVNNQKIPGGEIEIGLNVYGGKNPPPPPPPPPPPVVNQPTPEPSNTFFWQSISADYQIVEDLKYPEPNIRVGLFYAEKKDGATNEDASFLPIKIITLNQEPYQVKSLKDDYVFLTQTQGEETEIDFDFVTKKYFINLNGLRKVMTDAPLKIFPLNSDREVIFKITSWYRGPFWGLNVNDNEYQGTLEVKYNSLTNRLWLINELPMEKYLRGVAETPDYYPKESLKAQKIAARTYALFRYLYPKYTQVAAEDLPLFTVRATQADQVYRGYNWERRSPNLVQAVEETKGMVIFYGQDPILAYYFAQTDGRTRSSCEARMTKECLPYLISRPDPPGQGKNLIGHGVGLPQRSARVAAEQGASFHQILRYYYSGVEIKKVW